jgi:putative flippase GtrA
MDVARTIIEVYLAGQVSQYQPSPLLQWLIRLPVINRLGFEGREREFVRFLKFATVGAIGMVVDLTVLTLSHERLGLPLSVAVALGFSVAVLSNFTWNRLWTFPESRQRPMGSQLVQFVIINVIGLGINEVVILGLHPLFGLVLHDPAAYLAAKVIAIGIVLFWNYFANRAWTYRGIE